MNIVECYSFLIYNIFISSGEQEVISFRFRFVSSPLEMILAVYLTKVFDIASHSFLIVVCLFNNVDPCHQKLLT